MHGGMPLRFYSAPARGSHESKNSVILGKLKTSETYSWLAYFCTIEHGCPDVTVPPWGCWWLHHINLFHSRKEGSRSPKIKQHHTMEVSFTKELLQKTWVDKTCRTLALSILNIMTHPALAIRSPLMSKMKKTCFNFDDGVTSFSPEVPRSPIGGRPWVPLLLRWPWPPDQLVLAEPNLGEPCCCGPLWSPMPTECWICAWPIPITIPCCWDWTCRSR